MTYFEFTKIFPDENSAIDFIVATKYKDGYVCPKCGSLHKGIYHQKYNHRFLYCNNCKSEFSALKGTIFESIKHIDEFGNEYWTSRTMWKILEYTEYRHFLPVIEKAKIACQNSGQRVEDHFEDILEMVGIGSGAERSVDSIKLSRYACYLIVQNADPNKAIVAQGQTYFAIQTRIAELQQMEAGVIDSKDYAVFQNWGYKGLYGGMTAKDIHHHKGLKKSQKILDHMGSTELAANLFRATQTEEKLRRENIIGKQRANYAHYEVGAKVRQTIKELGGTMQRIYQQ